MAAADAKVAEAQQRADKAELAKIQLSLRLAELATDRDTDLPEQSPAEEQQNQSKETPSSGPQPSREAVEVEALHKR